MKLRIGMEIPKITNAINKITNLLLTLKYLEIKKVIASVTTRSIVKEKRAKYKLA